MDLGLQGKTALVCGASRGLGYACAAALVAEGVHAGYLNARNILLDGGTYPGTF